MKALKIYSVAAMMFTGTAFADITPAQAAPVARPQQSVPKPPPPPPDPLHLFRKKPARPVVRHRARKKLHIKLPPPPPAPKLP